MAAGTDLSPRLSLFGWISKSTPFCLEDSELFRNFADKLITLQTIMTKEMAIDAWKKALEHKKEAGLKFEKWLQEKGIEGKVVTL